MDTINEIAGLVREAERHMESLSKDRIRANEYYQGTMIDTPSDKGKSAMVKRLIRSHIKKVLPSITRTILNSDQAVEFIPQNPEDDESSQQATDYINMVIMPESDGRQAIYDAVHDALLLRNGILKWWYDARKSVQIGTHTGLPDEAFFELAGADDVDVLEHTERQEMVEQGEQSAMVTVHDCKIRRTVTNRRVRAAAVPRERFLIHPDAVSLDDSLITGEKTTLRKSDLVAMGYPKQRIMDLPMAGEDDVEESIRRDKSVDGETEQGPNQEVDYYDLFVRVDMDGDGIAELHHMCFAGSVDEEHLLMDEECDDVQYADIAVMRQPHQWEGISLADDLFDLQRVETVLLRQTLDNIYWQNNPQPTVQAGAVKNMDAVYNPEFGLPIEVNQGVDVRAAMGFNTVPFVATNSFAMLEYMDNEAQERTGVSDASSGLAPDALQNMTAKASAMIEAQGIGQTEMMVRTVADGLKRFFSGLLKMVIKHQDIPRTVRLRNDWVQFDPRDWNAAMDCTVNTGLGAGTRERDLMMMQQVMMVQEKLLMAFGPDNPFVKPDQIYNATAKMIEAAGLKTVDLYFTEPDPQEVQAKLEAVKNAPHPDQMKVEAQMQIEQAKMQGAMQMKQAEMQAEMQAEQARMVASTQKERAQMEADLNVKAAERQTQMTLAGQELAFKREELAANMRLELTKLGLQQSEDGTPVDNNGKAVMDMLAQTNAMLAQLGQHMASANQPKRIIRDESGDIVGVEQMTMRAN